MKKKKSVKIRKTDRNNGKYGNKNGTSVGKYCYIVILKNKKKRVH